MPETFPGAKEALDKLRPVLLALPFTDVSTLRFNAPQAVSNLLKVAGAFAEDRAQFESTFKKDAFNPDEHADLETRARALWQADRGRAGRRACSAYLHPPRRRWAA